jgi:succinyl-diaminopimelate desuccinylase
MSNVSPSAIDLCRALIQRPSVTPEDAGALGLIEHALNAAGFTTHRVVFSETGWPDTDNLYARLGDTQPCLLFAGHTDVVPHGDASMA